MNHRKKLIEVALPLVAINKACAREKSIRHGHPSTLHLWWARRPLAAARAVIFAQMVDDPSSCPDLFPTEKAQAKERKRLFGIIEELVKWENTTNERVIEAARAEIWQSWRRACAENADHPRAKELFDREVLPAFHDPFAGGGALPLEAQRLGLEAHASDLNPVAVLINKAMIEIPPKFAGRPPVNRHWQSKSSEEQAAQVWPGARGLAEDVRFYGKWMRDEAEKRIGQLYPKVKVTEEMARERPDLEPYVGRALTVIAWLWARTVKSPNPAFADVDVPLVSTFMLSTKKGKEAYVEPVVEGNGYRFTVKVGMPKDAAETKKGTKLSRGANFQCLMSGTPMAPQYIKDEGKARRMGARLMAIVAEGDRGRVYLAPTPEMEAIALTAQPTWKPETPLPADMRSHWTPPYGLETYGDLFTPRQLVALTTFSDLVQEARKEIQRDALAAGLPADDTPLAQAGTGARAYAEAVGVYLAFAVDKCSDYWSAICSWHNSGQKMRNTFGRQAIPMVWDYTEGNPFCTSTGNFMAMVDWTWKAVGTVPSRSKGLAEQADAASQVASSDKVISTDPPYYDNIGYADLSDFFYVWLKRTVGHLYPEHFRTPLTPKAEEIVQNPVRHGDHERAKRFFEEMMQKAFSEMHRVLKPEGRATVVFAHKSTEAWETLIAALIGAGFTVEASWPIHTEMKTRLRARASAALASSTFLVCKKRTHAGRAYLNRVLEEMERNIEPRLQQFWENGIRGADFFMSAIGPGLEAFSKYAEVRRMSGERVSVGEFLDEVRKIVLRFVLKRIFGNGGREASVDAPTQFALMALWSYGYELPSDEARKLAQGTGVELHELGSLVRVKGEKTRIQKAAERVRSDRDFGLPRTEGERIPVVDALGRAILLLTKGREAVAEYLAAVGHLKNETFWLTAQAIAEILEGGDEGRALHELLAYRDNLPAPKGIQASLFDRKG